MTFVRTALAIAALTTGALTTFAWAANDAQHDGHHPAATGAVQTAQATPGNPAMGMGMGGMGAMGGMADPTGHAAQMRAMQQMHGQMLAAKTPAERNALMAEHMKIMQNGMNMMGGMGGMGGMGAGSAPGKPADMAARQGMMEQRMDMMQSMMQMMLDRMPAVPATK
jgi:hypothetical protein